MNNKMLKAFLGLEILLCVLLGAQAVRYWFNPLQWGWPHEIKQRSFILIVFVAVVLLISGILSKLPKLGLNRKLSATLCLIVTTFGFGLFIMLYLPKSPSIEEVLRQEQYYPQDIALLTECAKVNKFVSVGSRSLDIGNRTVLAPAWLHNSLETIPKDTLVDCFLDQILEQEAVIANNGNYDEGSVRNLHALIFEADRLSILSHPKLLSHLGNVACNRDIDYFGKLILEFYVVSKSKLPPYDYYSDVGKEKMYSELCQ